MANFGASLLAHASSTGAVNLQIPPLSIKLTRENYYLWRSTVISALQAFDLESFIFNSTPPEETYISSDSDEETEAAPKPNPEYTLWKKRDRFVLLWITTTLSEWAHSLVISAHSSYDAWTKLEKTFQSQTRARRMAMKVQLQTITKGSLSMVEYIQRKRSIADSLSENLHPISEEDLIGYLLTGLDSSYAAFTTAFMMRSDGMTVDDLVGFLLQEEARIEHDHSRHVPTPTSVTTTLSPVSGSSAYVAHRPASRSFSANHNNSSTVNSPNRNSDNRRRRPMCQLCNRPGHEAIDCWQRNNQTDFPSRRTNPRDSSRQANIAQAAPSSSVLDPAWYIDSGATDHVTPDISKLNIADEYKGTDKLRVGNGQHPTTGGR